MDVYSSDRFVLPLPDGHPFPMAKYRRLRERVEAAAADLGIRLCEAPRADDEAVLRAHTRGYMERVREGTLSAAEQRRIGFPWSPAMAERTRRVSGATMAALEGAIRGCGVGVNLAGGTHHAHADFGAGYCVFNDTVVAARHVQALGLVRRILVVDLDVHQGNGTASICRDDPSIWTFSMHGARNYPAVKPESDLDVALPDGCGDAEYLEHLERNLAYAQSRSRAEAVIYLAGADPYAGDRLGYLSLSMAGLAARDQAVLDHCRRHGLPLAISMAGGYAPDVEDIVAIHFRTIELAAALARDSRWYPPGKPLATAACVARRMIEEG